MQSSCLKVLHICLCAGEEVRKGWRSAAAVCEQLAEGALDAMQHNM
jgi:hypothetical protein